MAGKEVHFEEVKERLVPETDGTGAFVEGELFVGGLVVVSEIDRKEIPKEKNTMQIFLPQGDFLTEHPSKTQ